MNIKGKTIHILPHNIYKFFPNCKKNIEDLKKIDHHSTRFISNIIWYDSKWLISHELWTIWDTKKIIEVKHKNWFIIKVFPQDFSIFLPLETSFSMIREIKKEIKYNKEKIIWHIHSYYLWMFDFIVIYLKLKKQIIFAHHRWWWFTWKALPYSIYKYVLILPIILRFCEKIFVQNKIEYNRLKNIYKISENKLLYFPNSTDQQKGKSIFLNNNILNIVFLWRLEQLKWIYDILSALFFLKENKIDFTITFIGDWTMKSYIQEYCERNNIKHDITWWISKDTVDELLNKQDIFIIANKKTEWSSNAVLEAQSFGLPVISYNIEWINDFIIDWKSWFLVNSLKEFKTRLLSIAKDTNLLKNMSVDAQDNINKNFNKKAYFSKLLDIYYLSIHSSIHNSR